MPGIAKKWKSSEDFVAKKLIKQDKQELKNCLCQQRNPTIVSWVMAQIQDLQKKLILCQTQQNFLDPEFGSSSGAIHVPDQICTILSFRTLTRCDSGLSRNSQNCTSIIGYGF